MKLILILFFLSFSSLVISQVAIGTDVLNNAAALHLETAKYNVLKVGGFLMPVVSEPEQASIPVSATDDGLMVFVSDSVTGKWCWEIYDATASIWRSVRCWPELVPLLKTK